MNEQTNATATTLSAYSLAYWRFCSIALGVALLISLAVNASGPARAGAATPVPRSPAYVSAQAQDQAQTPFQIHTPAQTPAQTPVQSPDHRQGGSRLLSIGGFDTIDGSPVFVIVDAHGHRVGTLPMTASAGPVE